MMGNILVKGMAFITMPLLMHYLSPDDIARYGMYSTAVMLLSTLLSFGLRQTVWLEYHHIAPENRAEFLKNIIASYGIISLPTTVFIYMACYWYTQLPFWIIALVMLHAWLCFFPELLYQWLIYTKQTHVLITTQISGALGVGITLLLLYYSGLLYWYYPCIALCIGTLLPTLIACIYFYKTLKNIQTTLTLNSLKAYLKLGLPFIPTILANWCIISAQRFIIAQQCSLYDAGLYSLIDLMHQLCAFLLLQPTATIYLPEIFERFSTTSDLAGENKQVITHMWSTLLGLSFLGFVAYFPAYYCAMYIIPSQYIPVLPLTLIAYVGNIFLLGTYFLQCLAQFRKRTLFLSTSLCTSGILSIIFSYALIPLLGLTGAAWATTIAYGIYFMMCYLYNLHLTTAVQ